MEADYNPELRCTDDAMPVTAAAAAHGEVEAIHCPVGSTATKSTVLVDVDLSRVSATERVAILRRSAEHLKLPVEMMRLLPSASVVDLGMSLKDYILVD